MAKLVMTIDSDGEIEQKVKGRRLPKPVIVSAEDEQILLSSDVLIQTDKKQVRVGSNQMWNFKDAVVVGKHAQSLNDALDADETTAQDERAPFRIPIE